jgi:hypothetical protein
MDLALAMMSGWWVIIVLLHNSPMVSTYITSASHKDKGLFNDALRSVHYITLNRKVNNELQRVGMEAVVAKCGEL